MNKYTVKVLFQTPEPLSQEAGLVMWEHATYFRSLSSKKYDREVRIETDESDREVFSFITIMVMDDMHLSLAPFLRHPEEIEFLAFAIAKE